MKVFLSLLLAVSSNPSAAQESPPAVKASPVLDERAVAEFQALLDKVDRDQDVSRDEIRRARGWLRDSLGAGRTRDLLEALKRPRRNPDSIANVGRRELEFSRMHVEDALEDHRLFSQTHAVDAYGRMLDYYADTHGPIEAGTVGSVGQANFDRTVLSSKLPVLVEYSAVWCGMCRAAAPVIKELAASYKGRVVFAQIDTGFENELAQASGFDGLPAFAFYKDGRLVHQFVGLADPKDPSAELPDDPKLHVPIIRRRLTDAVESHLLAPR